MLGLIYKKQKDTVPSYLEGKHPSFKDYVQIGDQSPISNAFSSWLRGGYANWALQANSMSTKRDHALRSWRFWCKGAQEDQLAWGIVRDSSDSIGRRYPLLIISWQNRVRALIQSWEKLPGILEGKWQEMEIMATRHFKVIKELISAIKLVSKGINAQVVSNLSSTGEKTCTQGMAGTAIDSGKLVANNNVFQVALGHVRSDEEGTGLVAAYSNYLKDLVGKIPSAVFVGGPVDMTQLFFFYRPLSKIDFETLWSLNYSG